MEKTNTDLKALATIVTNSFPRLNMDEQEMAVQIYRLLSRGEPVSVSQVGKTSNLSSDAAGAILREFTGVFYDEAERIIGFWGLALAETDHRFVVEGRTLYTWCAWDSLFIPRIIDKTADVLSVCPITGRPIRVSVRPDRIETFEPANAAMSFVTPETAKIQENVVQHFCHYVHFFSSQEAGRKWTSKNGGTFLLSMEEAFRLGRLKNEIRYKDVLARL